MDLWRRPGSVLGLLPCVLLGCQGATPDDRPWWEQNEQNELSLELQAALASCHAWDTRFTRRSDPTVIDEYAQCRARCILDASCEDLRELLCSASPNHANPLVVCISPCPTAPEHGWTCDDHLDRIPHAAVCDGVADCRDQSDEVRCQHRCADGQEIPGGPRDCDGTADCRDGSDELGCASICSAA